MIVVMFAFILHFLSFSSDKDKQSKTLIFAWVFIGYTLILTGINLIESIVNAIFSVVKFFKRYKEKALSKTIRVHDDGDSTSRSRIVKVEEI